MLSAAVLERIASEVKVTSEQVARTVALLDAGNTIPFIARYRKDATGGLDEVRLEAIEERNHYFTALEQRRRAVLQNIEKAGKLTDSLRAAIESCMDKTTLEDLYLPYRRKRQSRAMTARARGLAPLAEYIRTQSDGHPMEEAAKYVDPAKGVADAEAAIAGARDILAESIAEDAETRAKVRDRMATDGILRAHATKTSDNRKTKFEAYYDSSEPLAKMPAHRLLAILRGNREGVLRVELELDDASLKDAIISTYAGEGTTACAAIVKEAASDAYDRLLRPSIESEVLTEARQRADESAIRVFRENVRSLLLAPPAGRVVTMGVDPGLKSGCKLAVVGDTGDLVGFAVVHPEDPEKREEARAVLHDLVTRLNVRGIAVGNGTGSREAMAFVRESVQDIAQSKPFVAVVSESGASVYSASKLAREEFPDLDITLRGAVSIARRLQDPLSELVKIEPRSIGVGQYQHDVNQKRLREGLHQTVAVCVNRVGAEVNTASVSLLRYVAGIQYGTAQNLVELRTQKGGFRSRNELQEVPGIGPKIYQQCAGFLRIADAENPLDATGVHPDAYEIVEKMSESVGVAAKDLIGNRDLVGKLNAEAFVNETFGPAGIQDILKELAQPGRDPRRRFAPVVFDESVRSVQDVEEGMVLPGMVTNVTDFGAFVDVGVGQEGLVHLSELTHRYVRDPRQIVRVGDSVRVKVISVDKDASRLSFSIKALEAKREPRRRPPRGEGARSGQDRSKPESSARGTRPGPRDSKRPERKSRKPERKKRRQKHDARKGGPISKTVQASDGPLNTQLADQLADLKDKLNAG